ncbi:hypothetical protein HRW18_00445 [Streptomyces lunaelactis]|uniref:hypothetical protein n=1 Tax=Streptomyces lunaelactis TaxID=1535768 RepID=UPI001584D716|nr:hypothetical protein [Streptomyces lunaelactis]NUK04651.1 hypothetical protein [Streptomyces lunaelactis]NUK06513.1 hypothetical protein [Streptomyces lunaelactis]NUK17585.1 hypothetical protein [Streptomyces lunaelactis]NUK60859.1 hypothetical protein [Streptomyces lunaelactis]NUL08241.1 hypothetical protein [Streptomyces lunaelactis]
MNPHAPRRPRMQRVTTTGTALAVTLLPLMVGVLVAKSMGADPMSPVNALITSGGQRARVCPSQLRSCGRTALRRWKPMAARVQVARLGAGAFTGGRAARSVSVNGG